MPLIISNIVQGSPEWMELRLGNPGAASISKIITSKGNPSKQAKDYMLQMAAETISGRYEETYQSQHMTDGIEREAENVALFEMVHDIEVRRVALVYKDEHRLFHCSPDGLIGDDGGLEVKSPMGKTQIKRLLDNKLPTEYFGQIQMSLYVCEREYWWFQSYYAGLDTFTIRVERDEDYISLLEKALYKFVGELQDVIKELSKC